MVDKWEGFSEDDIIAMKSTSRSSKNFIDVNHVALDTGDHMVSPLKKTTIKQNKFGRKNNKRVQMLTASLKQPVRYNVPPEAALLNSTLPKEADQEQSTKITCDEEGKDLAKGKENVGANREAVLHDEVLKTPHVDIPFKTEESVLMSTRKEESLDEFEKRHKMIKEQNRMKKELLKLALEDRTKKTKEEARRLGEIEDELKKIDLQLTSDVKILRNQIEVASLDFMEVQKRYDRAEREFLDAKMELFTKQERKELLTAHLCTIIEQSELRKARKLSDLMDKLRLGSVIIEKPMDAGFNQQESKEVVNPDKCQDISNA